MKRNYLSKFLKIACKTLWKRRTKHFFKAVEIRMQEILDEKSQKQQVIEDNIRE